MAIATAIQNGSSVDVYDEKGSMLFSKNGTLEGYTGSTVSVKNGSFIYVYDGEGKSIFTKLSDSK